MIRFFAGHPTAANLLMLLLVAIGLMALPGLRRETFPEIPVDEIEIRVPYPGAAPDDVEESICRRIEDAVDGIEDVHEVRSEALEGLGKVTVEIVEGADVQIVIDDVRTEVEAIDDFPEETDKVVIRQVGRTLPVASVAVTGGMPLADLKAHCEDLKDLLLRDPEIEIVEVRGFSDHQIRIEVPQVVLMQYGVSAADIADVVRRQSIDLPAGTIEGRDANVIVRFTEERRRGIEFEDLIVISGDSGAEIRLGDVATITDVFELDEDKFLFNGKRAGLLQIEKTRKQDSLDVVAALEHFIAEQKRVQPRGTDLFLTQDTSSIVKDRLSMLVKNGWQGLILVFLALWLFFSFRLSVWVVLGLPVSFLGAFFVMSGLGYSLNMLTMVALLLALGLLMDDAIVLAENIATHLAKGKNALEAVVAGVNEVKVGVFSSFLTTVMVFAPLSFLSGDIGVVLEVLPVVLIVVLVVSLVEAFLILPSHLAHSLSGHDVTKLGSFRRWFEARIEWVRERVVGRAVDWTVRWRYLTLGSTIMVFLGALGLMAGGVLKFQAFPDIDGDVVVARVLMPQGTPLARTEQVVERITTAFDRINEELKPRQPGGQDVARSVSVQHNVNADANEAGPHVATVTVDLLGAEVRDAPIDELLNRWREEVGAVTGAVSLTFAEPQLGPAGNPIEIRVTGDDLDACKSAALAIEDWLRRYRGVYDVFDDLRPGKPEIRVRLREGAASLGASSQQIARQLRAAIFGETAREIQVGSESYEIDVRVAAEDRDSIADLEYFHVTVGDGLQVPVDSVAQIERARSWARIARVDGRRTVTVRGNVDSRAVNVTELLTELERVELPNIAAAHPGVSFSFEGEIKNGEVTGASLRRAFAIGVLGVFFLLSFQFKSYVEPLVVMLAIPMCLIGVILGHVTLGLDLTLPSMLGFVSLAGVVVNDSILLVVFLKARRGEGVAVADAARQASRLRFRAVLLTSVTTIAGMLPLLTETSLQAQILVPLVASIVFGLATSTVLVLLVLPATYTIVADLGLASRTEPGGAL